MTESDLNQLEISKICKSSVNHLWRAGKLLEGTSSKLSRFYVHQMQEICRSNQISLHSSHQFCGHCGSFWSPELGHRVKLKHRPVLSKNLRKLFRASMTKPSSLTKKERKLISTLKNKCNQVVYSCGACHKKTSYNGKRKTVLPKVQTDQESYFTPSRSAVSSPRTPNAGKSSDKRRRSLLHQVLEKELYKTPSTSSKSNLKNFLRSV